MKNRSLTELIFLLLGGIVLLFIVAPLLGMFLSTSGISVFETAKEQEVIDSISLTLLSSLGATLAFSVGAIPLAYLVARKQFIGKRIVQGIIDLPVVIPHSAAGIAILGFISRDTVLGKMADSLGFSFIGNPAGIAVAMGFVSVPYLFNAARDGFAGVPLRLEKAALNLGASQARVFFTISLPLAWRNIISGFILMFARGLSEFGAVVIIAYHPMVTPVLIYERFSAFGLSYAKPVSVIFITVSLIFFIVLRLLTRERKEQ